MCVKLFASKTAAAQERAKELIRLREEWFALLGVMDQAMAKALNMAPTTRMLPRVVKDESCQERFQDVELPVAAGGEAVAAGQVQDC